MDKKNIDSSINSSSSLNDNNINCSFEEEYKKILQLTREIVVIFKNSKIVFFNRSLEKVSSYTKEELINMDVNKLILKEDLDTVLSSYIESSSEEYISPYQFKMYGKNKKIIWVEISSTEIIWYGEKSILCFLTDVTKRREYEIALHESEKRKSLLINSMKDLIFVLDCDLRLKELYNFNSLDTKDFIGKKINELNFPLRDISLIKNALWELKETKEAKEMEYSITNENSIRWFQAVITLIESSITSQEEFLFVIRDITKLKEAEKEIKELSYKDPLTDSYNRRYIFENSDTILNSEFALVLIDLDYFKRINDNFGHVVGDFILKEFSKFVKNLLNEEEIFARYGGEEFLLILPNMDKNLAFKKLSLILKSLNEEIFTIEDLAIKISFSAGISDFSEIKSKKNFLDSLIDLADKRLYYAKETGRNKIIFD